MMKRFLFAISGLLLLTANSSFVAQAQDQDSSAVVEPQNLEGILSFTERPSGKTAEDDKPISASQHLVMVDFESLLIIDPDKELLRMAAETDQEVLPPLSDVDQARLDNLPDLIEAAQAYVDAAVRVVENIEAARRFGVQRLSAAEIDALQQQIAEQADIGLRILQPLGAIAEARAKELHPDDEDAAEDALIAMTDPLFMDEDGNPVILNVPRFAAFLRQHINSADRQIGKDAETAARQGTTRLRMRAWLHQAGEDRVAVSISSYDDIEQMTGPKRSRIAFRMTAREQQRLRQGIELATKASSFVDDVRTGQFSFRTELKNLQQTISQEVQILVDTKIDALQSSNVAVLKDAIFFLEPQATEAQKNSLSEISDFLGTFDTDLKEIRTNIKALKEASETSPLELIQRVLAIPETIVTSVDRAIGFAKTAKETSSHLKTLKMLSSVSDTTQIPLSLKSKLETLLPETETSLNTFAARYREAALRVKEFINLQQIDSIGDAMDDVSVDPRVHALELDNVAPGTINLEKTPADQGDKIEVRAELLTIADDGEEKILDTFTRIFEIQRFGWTSDFSSNMVFADRIESDSSQTQFKPAAGTSLTLHYRPRTGPGASLLAKLWDIFDLGFGLNVVALNFDDASLQVGLGAHASLFGDLVSFGYGYNIQAKKDHTYYYLGISILKSLNTVGGLVGGGSR